ncbi:MAG: hypothetical protein ACRYHQ_04070 [Janthinobacterium lividum]
MNNYTGFSFLPPPTRPMPKIRRWYMANPAAMPSTSTTKTPGSIDNADTVVQHTAAADHTFPLATGQS